jgi:CDP-diglyceride synthetase
MTALVSRVVVAVVLLPLVFLIVWAGGWWLVALATVVALVALHELYLMTRDVRPVLLAG